MAVSIEAYEDWGPAVNVSGNISGTYRTKVTNLNLKTISDPAQNYFLNDLVRPVKSTGDFYYTTFTRYISFKIFGTYQLVKNIKIDIPSGYDATSDANNINWRVMYGLRKNYVQPTGYTNILGRSVGNYDGTLNTLKSAVTLYPFLSTTGPEYAVDRNTTYGPNTTIWTQYLVLQFMVHAGSALDVDNFGVGNITVTVEELEY